MVKRIFKMGKGRKIDFPFRDFQCSVVVGVVLKLPVNWYFHTWSSVYIRLVFTLCSDGLHSRQISKTGDSLTCIANTSAATVWRYHANVIMVSEEFFQQCWIYATDVKYCIWVTYITDSDFSYFQFIKIQLCMLIPFSPLNFKLLFFLRNSETNDYCFVTLHLLFL